MLVVDLTQEEVDQRVEYFFNGITTTVNRENHRFKFQDDEEICKIINHIFKLSGSKLRLHMNLECDEPVFILKPLVSQVNSDYSLYAFYHQFNHDILALKDVLRAFRHVYRFKRRYQHLWE